MPFIIDDAAIVAAAGAVADFFVGAGGAAAAGVAAAGEAAAPVVTEYAFEYAASQDLRNPGAPQAAGFHARGGAASIPSGIGACAYIGYGIHCEVQEEKKQKRLEEAKLQEARLALVGYKEAALGSEDERLRPRASRSRARETSPMTSEPRAPRSRDRRHRDAYSTQSKVDDARLRGAYVPQVM
jgi:hypothetical protein